MFNIGSYNFNLLGLSNEPFLQHIFVSIFLGIYVITLSGNLVIILLTLADPNLYIPMYFFLRNLSLLEICYTSVTVPKMLDNFYSGNKSISFIGCALQTYFSVFLGKAECFLLGSMAYDRYVAICKLLYYPVLMSQRVYTSLTLASWLSGIFMSFVITSMVFTLSFCHSNVINQFFCDIPPLLKLACRIEIALFLVAILYVTLPFILILTSYSGIILYIIILKISSSEGRKKTFSTCSSHLIVVTLFFGSSSIIYLKPNSTYSPNIDKYISLFNTFISPVLNPVIYNLRNKEVKGAFMRIWERKPFD